MYKIIGGDGREYGPITADTMREWIAQGRANADTKVLPEGETSWQSLGAIPEFSGLVGTPTALESLAASAPNVSVQEEAQRLATPVGWAMIIVGILGVLLSLLFVAIYATKGVPPNPFLEKYMPSGGSSAHEAGQRAGAVMGVLFSAAWSAFVIFAGAKMRRLESWGLVLAGAIMAGVPCCGGQLVMCFPGLPVAIWAVVVLSQPKVKSAFS